MTTTAARHARPRSAISRVPAWASTAALLTDFLRLAAIVSARPLLSKRKAL